MIKFTTIKSILLSVLVSVSALAFAEIPAGYYNKAEGTKAENLKTILSEIIQPTKVLKYGGKGEGYTWQGFSYTDKTSTGYVLDRYSNVVRSFNGILSVDGMHIEHSFANSWWGGINNNAYKDIMHLYPADGSANISKSNHPIGIVTESGGFNNGVIKVGLSNCYRADSLIKVWEPADMYKGDFARTYMYMVTCYEDYSDLWTSEGLLMLDKNTYPVLKPWVVDILLKWNQEDPVSELEKNRNEEVYKIQGNRNPFIDYPQLAEYIWGDKTNAIFYTNFNESTTIFIPENNSTIDFGLQPLNYEATQDILIRGNNLSENLSVSLSNDIFQITKSTFTPEEIKDGVKLTIKCNPNTEGAKDAILILKSASLTQTVNIHANFINGIPAYPATSIVCSNNTKSFVANWMTLPGSETVSLDVYTKDSEGAKSSITGYPKDVTANKATVSVSKANTTYFYSVSSGNLHSNEIETYMPVVPPVFSSNKSNLNFFTKPNKSSFVQQINLTTLNLITYQTQCTVTSPFEISADKLTWGQSATLEGNSQSLYVRMGTTDTEGEYEAELILTTPDADDLVVNLFAEVSQDKSFFEDFENGTKTAYASDIVNCTSSSWAMTDALIGNIANDQKNGSKSVRIKGDGTLIMNQDKTDGLGTLSFFAGAYGSDTGMAFNVDYSTDGGLSWLPIATKVSLTKGEWKTYSYKIELRGNARVKFTAVGSASKRINIDDVKLTDYPENSGVCRPTENSKYTILIVKNNIIINSPKEAVCNIYDGMGKLIYKSNIYEGSQSLNTSLSSGYYILNIVGEESFKLLVP